MKLKTLENRMRRLAKRQQLAVVKSRNRVVVEQCGGYLICDNRNHIVAGGVPTAYSLQLHEVERFLTGPQG